MKQITYSASILAALATLSFSSVSSAATEQQLLRCMDTQFEQGAYGQYYGMTYHGTDQVCGGDDLGSGRIGINDDGTIRVELNNANHDPFVLYEVYWIPVGQDPVTHRVMVGNIMTDCNGNASNTLRDISAPVDSTTAAETDISARVGNKDAGNFYFYSRGPWGFSDDGTCKPSTYNTSDGTEYGTVANPELWGSTSNPFFDGVQFISGYELTGGSDSGEPHDNPDKPDFVMAGPFNGIQDTDLILYAECEGDGEKPEHCMIHDPAKDPEFNPEHGEGFYDPACEAEGEKPEYCMIPVAE